jgi:Protein kinase domain/WD40-like Beta Propeller Repeat
MRIGSSLGRYRITGKIGEGGMGQVFRAEDDRLHRQVAIKILPPEMSRDRERLARMEREAHALAQLEHQNIAGIFGLEEATPEGENSPISFLVMQFAEGETLAARIDSGPIPLREAVDIALQIARALEAAHDKGIVHRDLKPANIVLSSDSKVKLLDFGLAKAYSAGGSGSMTPDLSMSPTVVDGTQVGVILGTAGYMSPEQARGKAVDRRTDVWAFGCVLYEMLTGRRVFQGETVTDVLGAIVHRDPDWRALPATTPAAIRSLVERCLRKDIGRRTQSIGDVRIALEEYQENPTSGEPVAAVPAAALRSRTMQAVPWVLSALAAIAAGVMGFYSRSAPAAERVSRFSVEIGDRPLYQDMSGIAISSDGSRVAYNQIDTAVRRLTVRPMDQLVGRVVAEGGQYNPFFSPDGEWLGFVTASALMKAPAGGGTALTLAPVARSRGATWATDDSIIIAASSDSGLSRMPASGGPLTALTSLDKSKGEATHRWPQYVAGHDVVIFTAHTAAQGGFDGATIEALNIKTGVRKSVYRGGTYGRYVSTGHLLFVNKATIFAVPFDIASLEVVGSPAPVAQAVSYSAGAGSAQYAVADSGVLIYSTGLNAAPTYDALWVDAKGEGVRFWDGQRSYAEPRVSPDGSKVTFMVFADNNWDVWVYDRVRAVSTRLTFENGIDGPGVWSPDGKYLIFSSAHEGPSNLYRKRADGSGDAERLTNANETQYVSSWSADGKYIVYTAQVNGSDLWILPLEGDRKPKPFLATPFTENEGAFSPDSRWIAYQSNESGRVEVYIRPLQGAGKWQVSEGGGGYPRWSGDGRQLFFRDDEGVMSVPIAVSGDSIAVGRARRALKGAFRGGVSGIGVGALQVADYDIARDVAHFVMFPIDAKAVGRTEHLTFVLNWFTELRHLLPASR